MIYTTEKSVIWITHSVIVFTGCVLKSNQTMCGSSGKKMYIYITKKYLSCLGPVVLFLATFCSPHTMCSNRMTTNVCTSMPICMAREVWNQVHSFGEWVLVHCSCSASAKLTVQVIVSMIRPFSHALAHIHIIASAVLLFHDQMCFTLTTIHMGHFPIHSFSLMDLESLFHVFCMSSSVFSG